MRVGNAAHAQLQLDVYGELIDAFHQSRMARLELDEQATWALECAVLEHLAEVWDQPDHGIWERRGEGRHYVFVEGDDLGRVRPRHQERRDASASRRRWCTGAPCATPFIAMSATRGFDAEENAFVESYGSKLLDASI